MECPNSGDADFLLKYVLNNNPDVKKENILVYTAVNQYDLVVLYKNGKRELFDTYDNTRRYIIYETEALTEEEHRREFPKLLSKMIRRRGITQAELAERIGTTQQMVSKYISGTALPGYTRLKKMAEVLSCSVEDLYLHFDFA